MCKDTDGVSYMNCFNTNYFPSLCYFVNTIFLYISNEKNKPYYDNVN